MQPQYTRGRGEFVCQTCGVIVETQYASQARGRSYCSRDCSKGKQPGRTPVRPVERFLQYVEDSGIVSPHLPDGGSCWLWTGTLDDPNPDAAYGVFTVDYKQVTAHRFSWELANGPIPETIIGRNGIEDKALVCHGCGISRCVRPQHLYLGTPSDNMEDRKKHGRTASGDRSGQHTMPWRTARGDRNGTRTHPESRPRGDNHPARRIPGWRQGTDNGNAKLTETQVLNIFQRSQRGEKRITLAREYGVSAVLIGLIATRRAWKHATDPVPDKAQD